MRFVPAKPSLYGETLESLQAALQDAGFQSFRAKQITDWLYKKRVEKVDDMTNLPQNLRQWLGERYVISPSKQVLVKQASDITEKLLLEQEDGRLIETVLIRYPMEGVGQDASRKTICVSSQVGCAYGCRFCASGLAGWKRNLTQGEIVGQFLHVSRLEAERFGEKPGAATPIDNIVFMGMGEPLANYDAVVGTIRLLNADWGLGFGARRITISTSGLAPQIRQLADEPIQFRLALSLHGATNDVRQQIMPVNRKYPLEELLPAVEYFAEKHGRMLTLEYILIDQINDTFEQAHALSRIARDLHAHVNLIPYNKVEGLPWKRPNIRRQIAFGQVLKDNDVSFTIRKEKGHDIEAACGQLRLQTERERGTLEMAEA
ncbi:MAG: 23S rRNA (adenine(2503)-C(2))-methyltransferase RlmN [Verrucomicrobiota bacterium JB022]|nr:23S rRNA (adenine(2503)-C(2))-methyltransferase RlmN [Verrucomicrobiota bacterium JB022]